MSKKKFGPSKAKRAVKGLGFSLSGINQRQRAWLVLQRETHHTPDAMKALMASRETKGMPSIGQLSNEEIIANPWTVPQWYLEIINGEQGARRH